MTRRRSPSVLLLVAAAGLCLAGPASAAIAFNAAGANFSNPVGGQNNSFADNDGLAGNDTFSWGVPANVGGVQTSLSFTSAGPQTVAQGVSFSLGELTFINAPIYSDPILTGVDLAITSFLTFDGVDLVGGPSLFRFVLDTTENAPPCPFPSSTPCSDRLTISALSGSSTFNVGGQDLTLYIDGFQDAMGVLQPAFLADENAATTATLIGRFDLASGSAVPEPGTWALMILGFGAVGGALRRRRQGSAFA